MKFEESFRQIIRMQNIDSSHMEQTRPEACATYWSYSLGKEKGRLQVPAKDIHRITTQNHYHYNEAKNPLKNFSARMVTGAGELDAWLRWGHGEDTMERLVSNFGKIFEQKLFHVAIQERQLEILKQQI